MKNSQLLLLITAILLFNFNSFSQKQNALDFDGIDDYVEINSVSNSLENSTNFTIEFWMKGDLYNQTSSIRSSLFAINPITSNGNGLLIIMGGLNSQEGKLMIYDEGTWGTSADFMSQQVIGDNQCHHIAYVRNGINGFIYIDGQQVGSHYSHYALTSSDLYSIGQEWDNLNTSPTTSQFYNGRIDEFRIWNVSRTSNEILNNMNSELVGTEPGLLAHFDCNQGNSGANNPNEITLDNQIQNGLNGNLFNFSLSGANSNWVTADCISSFTVCDSVVYDTIAVYDTIRITVYDTVTVFDTVVIYDTISTGGSGNPSNINETNNIDNSVSIYPNPTSGDFTIELIGDKQKFTQFEVYDTKGSLVLSKNLNNVLTTIPSSEISVTGIYYIRFMANDRKYQLVKKLIID